MRTVRSTAAILLALGVSAIVFVSLRDARVNELTDKVDRLEQERKQLVDYARRLTKKRRVAQVNVLDQSFSPEGPVTSLLRWTEIHADGSIAEPIYREVVGDLVYFEAATLKFEHNLVGGDKTEQTASLALFRRIFGDRQVAAAVPDLHADSTREGIAKDDPSTDHYWKMFWRFMDDPQLAEQYGVRVAQVEAPAIAPKIGQVWEVSLDASGGLNLVLASTDDSSSKLAATATSPYIPPPRQ